MDVKKETRDWGTALVSYNYNTGKTKVTKKKYKNTWCKCKVPPTPEQSDLSMFNADGLCDCGIHKHHIHCKKCGGVTQIG